MTSVFHSTMAFYVFLLLGVVSCAWGLSGPTSSNKFDSYLPTVCESNWDDVKDVDACIGCFCRFSSMKQSAVAYDELLRCKQTYLTQSPYDACKNIVVDNTDGTSNTSETYCKFEKCIASVSTDDLARGCITEADPNGSLTLESFIKAATCILAHHRCRPDPNYSQYSGSSQRSNALYVNKDDQLELTFNIYAEHITSPCNTGPDGQYIYNPNPISQADWPSAQCPSTSWDTTATPPQTFIS